MRKSTLDGYYGMRKLLEATDEAERKSKIEYKEARRPYRECDEVLFYNDYAIERFSGVYGDTFRVLAPQQTPGGRFGNGGGMRDVGYEFERLGDAYNYIDDLN